MGESLGPRMRSNAARTAAFVSLLAAFGCADTEPGPSGPPGSVGTPGTAGAGGSVTVPGVGGASAGGTGGSGVVTPVPTGTPLPCDVSAVVKSNCESCHGSRPIGGAPMWLVTHEDFMRDHVADHEAPGMMGKTIKVHPLVRMRLNRPSGRCRRAARWRPPTRRCSMAGSARARWRVPRPTPRACSTSRPDDPDSLESTKGQRAPDATASLRRRGPARRRDLLRLRARRPDLGRRQQVHDLPRRELRAVLLRRAVADRRAGHALRRALRQPAGAAPLAAVHDRRDPRAHGSHETVHRHAARRQQRASCSAAGRSAAATSSSRRTWASSCRRRARILTCSGTSTTTRRHQQDGSAVQRVHGAGGHAPEHRRLTWLGTENFYGPIGMPPGQNEFERHLPERLARADHDLGLLAAHARARRRT